MLLWFKTVPLRSTLHLCQEVALYMQILEQPENKTKMMRLKNISIFRYLSPYKML